MDDSLYDRLRILVVDDEKIIVEKYKTILSSFPSIDVTVCHQGEDAVRAAEGAVAENRHYALAFLDLGIPAKQDELWTAENIRKSDPFLEIVIVTAYCNIPLKEIIRRVPPADKLLYLQKPFDAVEIEQFVLALGTKWQKETQLRKDSDLLKHQFQAQSEELKKALEELKEENAARRSADETCAECKEIFDAFMKYQPAAAFIKDHDGRYLYVNQAYKTAFRCESADRIGKSDEDIWPVQVTENLKATDQSVISQGKTLNIIEALPLNDKIQYYLTSKFPIFRQGKPVFIGGIAVNLTDRLTDLAADKMQEVSEGTRETRIPVVSEEENGAGLMSLPGLDIGDALKRLEGSWELYADLLSCFCEDKKDFSIKFKELIEKKNFETALISAHALKGSAATISATKLRDAAKALEDACAAEDEAMIIVALKNVENALKKVETSFGRLPSVPKLGLGNEGDQGLGNEREVILSDSEESEILHFIQNGGNRQNDGNTEYPGIEPFGDENCENPQSSGLENPEHSEIQLLCPEIDEARYGQPFENLLELFRKFDKCLQESDPAGAGYLQEIEIFFSKVRFNSEIESLFGKLSEQTYNYSFDAARETLILLIRNIQNYIRSPGHEKRT
ncbi:MAG: hypothetical protein BWK80_37200 [Desulfobacteraceae bacterium IS3]|nr:MAG: hypothetical protein BWK80_37200 [Desulfobacteraceae bacterium IS3]